MKTKLTLSIDKDLLPLVKKEAKKKGLSVSSIFEDSLRLFAKSAEGTFSERWMGKFVEPKGDVRRSYLGKRFS